MMSFQIFIKVKKEILKVICKKKYSIQSLALQITSYARMAENILYTNPIFSYCKHHPIAESTDALWTDTNIK